MHGFNETNKNTQIEHGYKIKIQNWNTQYLTKQESPAIADKPARRESLPKIAPIRRAYNVVADDTGLSSFV